MDHALRKETPETGAGCGTVEVVDVPGDPFTVVEEPHVQILARELAARIARHATKGETLPAVEVSSVPNLAR
jgi:hypothetical protein